MFYHFALRDDPVSFDWNLNLYAQAAAEMSSGLLTFDADLNAIPDWAETFTPNEDASVWTFNIRPDNQGWTNGTDTRPVTAQDFVYSWERQLNPANAARVRRIPLRHQERREIQPRRRRDRSRGPRREGPR